MKRNKETEQKKQAAGNYPDFEVRTDLAVEEQERFPGDGGEISGGFLAEMAGVPFRYPYDGSKNSG